MGFMQSIYYRSLKQNDIKNNYIKLKNEAFPTVYIIVSRKERRKKIELTQKKNNYRSNIVCKRERNDNEMSAMNLKREISFCFCFCFFFCFTREKKKIKQIKKNFCFF